MRHLIDPLDFTLEETTKVLDLADRIAESPEVYSHVADGKKIATLFYEPSTRTRLSFESAMLSLGGKSLGFAGAEQSSATKGETVADTARGVSCYAAASQGRRSPSRFHVCHSAGNQCRGWRT